jgi:hypothetical protein
VRFPCAFRMSSRVAGSLGTTKAAKRSPTKLRCLAFRNARLRAPRRRIVAQVRAEKVD